MKKVVFLSFLLLGCTRHYNVVLHTTEPNPDAYRIITGEKCKSSGFQVVNKEYLQYFKNCDLILKRQLKEHEIKHWITEREIK